LIRHIILSCTIFNVGTDLDARRSLGALAKDGAASLQHVETGAIALETLLQLSESELPDVVVIPFRLPIMTGVDFVTEMRSHECLRHIPILVWGAHIAADEVERIYAAGASRVVDGRFGAAHLEAVRQLCPTCFCSGPELPRSARRRYAITAALRNASDPAARNARLGKLFAWTGCLSSLLWMWAFVQLGMSYTMADLAPLPVYGALASAGFSLMLARVGDRSIAR
jgi:CheY-like chemotaxis protein